MSIIKPGTTVPPCQEQGPVTEQSANLPRRSARWTALLPRREGWGDSLATSKTTNDSILQCGSLSKADIHMVRFPRGREREREGQRREREIK